MEVTTTPTGPLDNRLVESHNCCHGDPKFTGNVKNMWLSQLGQTRGYLGLALVSSVAGHDGRHSGDSLFALE